MTRFPLRRLRLRSGDEHREPVAVELEPFELGGVRYLPVPQEIAADLAIAQATSGVVLRLRFGVRLHGPCMRCLRDAVAEVRVDVREYHDADEDAAAELRSDYVVDSQVELSTWARDAIAGELPDQILHAPDCKGLCPVCGKDLNDEPHEHEETLADPRWAGLEALRDRL